MQKFSYHTHTSFSDGQNSFEDMLSQAVSLGWTEIGITDHLIVHKDIFSCKWNAIETYKGIIFDSFDVAYDVLSTRLSSMRETVKRYPIKVSLGLEVDFFTYEGWEKDLRSLLSRLDLDYVINGNHFVFNENCEDVINLYDLDKYIEDKTVQRDYMSRHFKVMKKAIESNLFSFIAHLDYARMGLCGEYDYKEERQEVIQALADSGGAFELSTKGLRVVGDFYPARWMMEDLKDKNVPVIISDDAHRITDLGKDFDKAEELLKELGYETRFSFR